MGSLYKSSYSIPIPENAKIDSNTGKVIWKLKNGKNKTGKLSTGRNGNSCVLIETDHWIAKFVDENGKIKCVSTKTRERNTAERFLTKLENEVSKIRAGIITRNEINQSQASTIPITEFFEKYRTKMIAEGISKDWIKSTFQKINEIISVKKIQTLAQIDKQLIQSWIANEIQSGIRSPRTINLYIIVLKTFLEWLVDIKVLQQNPLQKMKKLNENIGRRKKRRSLTVDELNRLFEAAKIRKCCKKNKAEEHVLIYRLLVGTGLRSSELSLIKPFQINFEQNLFTVIPENTKNKEPDVLPIRSDLAADLKAWIERFKIEPGQRIFSYNKSSIRYSFLADLKAAGIEQKTQDGRSVDVHSLRRTFGTMLARAGVPLTTTQRLMRHSTPELTAKLYIDVEPIDKCQAVEKLPAF
jgi:integrase